MKIRNKLFVFASLFLLISLLGFGKEIKFHVLFTNDIHGGIVEQDATFMNPNFPPVLGGGATMKKYVDKVREEAAKNGEEVFLVDAGDIFQGTPIGNNTKGEAIVKFFNDMKYDFWVIGNHEFDMGQDVFWNLVKKSNMPILCSNLVKTDTGEIPDGIIPYIFKEYKGLKIAFIGLTTRDTEVMSYKDNFVGLDVLDEVETLQKYTDEVRAKGADLVITVAHAGLPFETTEYWQRMEKEKKAGINRTAYYNVQDIVNRVNGVDILFAGHTHKGYDFPYEDPRTHTLVFENYAKGSSVGHVIFKIDEDTKAFLGYETPQVDGALVTLFKEQFGSDKEMANKIDTMKAEAEKGFDDIIGMTEVELERGQGESLLGNTINDAIIEISNADFSFINLGGMRDKINKGNITYRDVFRALPFDNKIVVLSIPGWMLKEILESRIVGRRHGMAIGGAVWEYSKFFPDYKRTTKFVIQGEPWDPEKIYKVATADFIAEGNLGLTVLADLPERYQYFTGITIRDAVAEYIKAHTPLSPKYDKRYLEDDTIHEYDPQMKAAMEKMRKMEIDRDEYREAKGGTEYRSY